MSEKSSEFSICTVKPTFACRHCFGTPNNTHQFQRAGPIHTGVDVHVLIGAAASHRPGTPHAHAQREALCSRCYCLLLLNLTW